MLDTPMVYPEKANTHAPSTAAQRDAPTVRPTR